MCNETKELTEFSQYTHGGKGLYYKSWCKPCSVLYLINHRAKSRTTQPNMAKIDQLRFRGTENVINDILMRIK